MQILKFNDKNPFSISLSNTLVVRYLCRFIFQEQPMAHADFLKRFCISQHQKAPKSKDQIYKSVLWSHSLNELKFYTVNTHQRSINAWKRYLTRITPVTFGETTAIWPWQKFTRFHCILEQKTSSFQNTIFEGGKNKNICRCDVKGKKRTKQYTYFEMLFSVHLFHFENKCDFKIMILAH